MAGFAIMNATIIKRLEKDMQDLARDLAGQNNLKRSFERMRDEVIIPSIDQNFARQGRPNKWPPLEPETIRKRAEKTGRRGISREAIMRAFADNSFQGSILIFTGKGRRSAVAKARFEIDNNTMTYGNWPQTTWYMQVHDVEAYANAANIPHRPFAMLQKEDVVACAEVMMEWVEDQVNKNIKRHYI